MFFKKAKKNEILMKKNIITGKMGMNKDDVINEIGQLLVDSGYVNQSYVPAMLEREETFATNMGNGIAIPHGVDSAKKEVKSSGLAIMTFPEGTDWNGENVKIVVAIAGKGDEHLDLLGNIAEKLCEEEVVAEMATKGVDEIYDFITSKEA